MGTSPVAQGQLSQLFQAGNQQISQIPTNMAMQFIGQGSNMAGGMMGNAFGGQSGAAQNQSYKQGFDWSSLISGMAGSAAGGFGGGMGLEAAAKFAPMLFT
jgi:hypothetical protein